MQVMKHGLRLTGTVRDPAGAPVANALVAAGRLYSYADDLREDYTTARTDRDGKFSIGGLPAGPRGVMVSAADFGPALVVITMEPGMQPVDVALDEGRTVTGRFVDEE